MKYRRWLDRGIGAVGAAILIGALYLLPRHNHTKIDKLTSEPKLDQEDAQISTTLEEITRDYELVDLNKADVRFNGFKVKEVRYDHNKKVITIKAGNLTMNHNFKRFNINEEPMIPDVGLSFNGNNFYFLNFDKQGQGRIVYSPSGPLDVIKLKPYSNIPRFYVDTSGAFIVLKDPIFPQFSTPEELMEYQEKKQTNPPVGVF